jgi:hypothetical protein
VTLAADGYDSPWKEALEQYLAECLELLFPEVRWVTIMRRFCGFIG